MNAMQVSSEKLVMTFSLAQVAALVIAFEDETMGLISGHIESFETADKSTVPAPANV